MAKKETAKKNKEKKDSKSFNFTKSDRYKLIIGTSIVLFAIYLFVVMISYIFTWKSDNIEWISIFSNADIQVDNFGGKLGAFLAHTLIYNWFGISSFAFPFLLIVIGFDLLGRTFLNVSNTLINGIITIIISSFLFGAIDNFTPNIDFLFGGQHGFFIIAWLNSFLGQLGTLILLLVIIFSYVIIVSKKAFDKIILWIKPQKKDVNTISLTQDTGTENINTNQDSNKENIELDTKIKENETPNLEEETIDFVVNTDKELPKTEEPLELQTEIPKEESIDILTEVKTKENNIENNSTYEIKAEDGELGLQVENLAPEETSDNTETPLEILGEYDPKADLSHFSFPSIDILADHEVNNERVSQEELNENKDKIVETLKNYKIEIASISATIGPSITLYEIIPAPGVRINKIKNLEDDIALSLAALGIRIIAPMPGKGTVGIEVPNKNPQVVSMRSTVASKVFQESKYELPIILGKTIYNKTHVIDLAKTPHMLVAGATGQGKSVGINAILTSLLYKKHPAELKFVLIDPKKVELSIYSRIEKHYLAKLPDEEDAIITDVQKVVATLNSLAKEMDARYDLLKNAHVRNIIEYNNKFIKRKLSPEKGNRYLPYIVVVIDEFADLIMTAGKEVEHPIARIAQLARAIGIHLIVATQRPAVNVITGMIKANFPTRVAFRVTQSIDSRTILDTTGANQLIGRGDMLVSQGGGDMVRLQCPFVDTPEIEELVIHIESQQKYPTALLLPEPDAEALGLAPEVDLKQKDQLFEEAARLMVQTQQGSTSSIQRKFSIGYNRAGRIIDQLEASGIVGPYEGSKARKVLYPDEYALEIFLKTLDS